MPNDEPPPRVWVSVGCAFVGGYVDVVSLIQGKAFGGHITGNTALLGVSLAERDWPTAARRGLAIACFVTGVAASAAIDRPLKRRATPRSEAGGFLVEAVLLAVAAVAFAATGRPVVFLGFACLALGLQTGNLRKTRGTPMHTTFVSGMVTRAVIGSAEAEPGRQPAASVVLPASVWPTFLAGAIAGGVLTHLAGVAAVWAAVALLVAFAAVDRIVAARQRAAGSRL